MCLRINGASVLVEKDSSSPSVLVVIATLNEEEGIGPTLAELREVLVDSRFLVVDGNSTEGACVGRFEI